MRINPSWAFLQLCLGADYLSTIRPSSSYVDNETITTTFNGSPRRHFSARNWVLGAGFVMLIVEADKRRSDQVIFRVAAAAVLVLLKCGPNLAQPGPGWLLGPKYIPATFALTKSAVCWLASFESRHEKNGRTLKLPFSSVLRSDWLRENSFISRCSCAENV